ncbi:Prefoldin subunit-domain-containing protein [Cercophora newfieldiana]|uniref:Prefoldin subunit-domain-containing protein n=1 Tax=Cercophora newfieldiana TaxID=92897 RepID=A0AA39YR71_9PEZI|nr:Prefoldin subunit-domain-containing protein [Cercophora newfieldiana]
MAQPKDHLSDLDRHMQQLEATVAQLRSSLTHWQQWYLEYSALKEEVEHLPKDPQPRKDLARIRRDFDSQLLTKKEINEIFGKTELKDTTQILSVLSRRIDYVEQNVTSLRKQLEAEEDKLSVASVVAHPDGGTDEESGLLITDIIEELDEEGNVVGARLQSGADTEPRVVEALKKAGITELPETDADAQGAEGGVSAALEEKDAAPPSSGAVESAAQPEQVEKKEEPKWSATRPKRSVSFAEDTKPGHDVGDQSMSKTAQKVAELMRKAKEDEKIGVVNAVIPDNESPEDSALRREMLEYSMSEIGPVVAELELEEDGSEFDDDDWATDEELETEDDDEDELGRSKHSVITGDYIRRMQELENRLRSQGAFAVSRPESNGKDQGVGQVTVVAQSGSTKPNGSTTTKKPKEPKSVRFASSLDIAEEKAPQPVVKAKQAKPQVNPIRDIVEHVAPAEVLDDEEEPPKRVSRFKKERAAAAPTVSSLPPGPLQIRSKFVDQTPAPEPAEPAPPEGLTIAPAVVERNPSSAPKEPDDMDDVLLYQAAAVEYNRLRNKMIQQQGGFLKTEETETVPLDEEEGGPPRMSRFKAARLAKP